MKKIKASQLQERRYTETVQRIERTVARREHAIATVVRLTNQIAAMARQVRRYERIRTGRTA